MKFQSINLTPYSRKDWAERITVAYRKSVESIVRTGAELIAAKKALPHGEFQKMVRRDLPFKERTAQKFMSIADHPVLSNASNWSLLPPSWATLYELSRQNSETVEALLGGGYLNSAKPLIEMTTADVLFQLDLLNRQRVQEELAEREPPAPTKPSSPLTVVPDLEPCPQPVEPVSTAQTIEDDAPALVVVQPVDDVVQEDADGVAFVERSDRPEPIIETASFEDVEPPGLHELRVAWRDASPAARRVFARQIGEV